MTEIPFTDPSVMRAVQLVWREAKLLDDKDYERWQELYTDDGVYVIPINPHTEDFASSLNMVYDDKRMRAMRVERMIQGYAPSAVAAARTIRTISRFTVESADEAEVVLKSAQVVVAYKRHTFDIQGGELTHTIRLDDAGDRIAQKVVRLVNSEDPVTASGYLL